ncbi:MULTISPECIES: SO_0444 family Cu/Zn efflux transporter [unclassified Pseudoalteromonas]|uniref:SO_0444 family Cu/Zn efflux transporter n=1 Tax=unclassified Pseudoalteromonas TaxID=194690 RepID=UPI00160177BE|nr:MULTISPECIES: SO_0444 family Cu/Zn efflux transporter [unclassified Pseudoalteromonas]MBB1334132.1 SO_0444 family Cu/Zn efflux transporter [Pseudoalteromonas sp. SR41-6]MBB1342017.1 SO_0444 family Cu/Zn efflux transporter [Pseudoalteromonas sp. SR45-6]MBB1459654.1 SO_0444 family Cu/Zn efflux transporter [Pseudoalteromonas sp. SG41-8]
MDLLNNFWQLFLLSAPWLMLGLLIAGLLNVYLPANFLNKHLGKEGFWTTVKAALIGAPMPLCSCGVIPAAIGLRRAGASKSATTAFLVSTPETGVDSVSVSYVLLGPFMAIIRPIAAICSAIVAGVLVGRDAEKTQTTAHTSEANNEQKRAATTSCCSTKSAAAEEKASCCSTKSAVVEEKVSCCSTKLAAAEEKASCYSTKPAAVEEKTSCCDSSSAVPASQWQKMKQAVSFSCNKLLSDTMKWLMIGLFFAALVQTYVPESFLSQWGSGILAMLVVIVISIPMYICATASTPIAAGLLLSGVAPGAVLVFMLAGPATNVATLGVVANELGKRAVVAYLVGVIGVALIFGFLTDYLVAEFGFVVTPLLGEEHQVLPHWLTLLCGTILALLMVRLVLKGALSKYRSTGKSIA